MLKNLTHRRKKGSRPVSIAGSDLSVSLYDDTTEGPEPKRGGYPIKGTDGQQPPPYFASENQTPFPGEVAPEYRQPHAVTSGTGSPRRSQQGSPIESGIYRPTGSRNSISRPEPLPVNARPEHDDVGLNHNRPKDVDAATVLARAQGHSEQFHVDKRIAPAVTKETIHREIHHVREEQITREIHTYDVYHRILPIVDVEVLPARHFLPVDGGGLVEVRAEDVPGRSKDWVIAETLTKRRSLGSAPVERRQFTARRFDGEEGDAKYSITPEGYERTEQTWVHPPELEPGARATGQTWPLEMGMGGLSLKDRDDHGPASSSKASSPAPPQPPPESTKPQQQQQQKKKKAKATIRKVP